jgi:hypothetical protein
VQRQQTRDETLSKAPRPPANAVKGRPTTRLTSEFSITRGSLPSIIATHELVVPKSMPITSPVGAPGLPLLLAAAAKSLRDDGAVYCDVLENAFRNCKAQMSANTPVEHPPHSSTLTTTDDQSAHHVSSSQLTANRNMLSIVWRHSVLSFFVESARDVSNSRRSLTLLLRQS